MRELSERSVLVIEALIQGSIAWRSPTDLAKHLGWSHDETNDILCDFDLSGWIDVWDSNSGILVKLSSIAATRWKARLVENGPANSPRWHRAGRVGDVTPRSPRSQPHDTPMARGFDDIADPRPMAAEFDFAQKSTPNRIPSWRGAPPEPPPHPSTLFGLSLTPWPGPGSPEICPACGSKRLSSQMYCLYCDRWGHDPDTSKEPPSERGDSQLHNDPHRNPPNRESNPRSNKSEHFGRKPRHPQGNEKTRLNYNR